MPDRDCEHGQRLLLRVTDVCAQLSIIRSHFYDLLRSEPDAFPQVRLGRSIRIPADAVRAFVERKAMEAASDLPDACK
jgi:excisionase family DNA binding protein